MKRERGMKFGERENLADLILKQAARTHDGTIF